jgi:hypothetical protein
MSDHWVEILGEELAALIRAPIKIEPISPPSSPNPVFAPSMPKMKQSASRGRGRSSRNTSREEPPRVNTKRTVQSRGGHRADSASVRQSSKPNPPSPRTPESPPEELNTRAIPKPGPHPEVEWFQCRPSTLTLRTVYKYIREFGLPDGHVEWAAPSQRANLPGEGYSAWSRFNIRAGVTLPLHPYFWAVVDYFDICLFQITPNGYRVLSTLYILYHFKRWGVPSPHEINYLFDLKSNPNQNNTRFFYFAHQESHRTFLSDVTFQSNPGKYYQEYFMTSQMNASNLAFCQSGIVLHLFSSLFICSMFILGFLTCLSSVRRPFPSTNTY